MSHLTGTLALARLVVRRERVRLAMWLATIAGLVYAQVVSIQELYARPGELARAAELVGGNAAFIAMAGPPLALDTLGGRVTFEISAFAMVLAALMNLFLATRHLRGDEEAGRTELVRSTVVGRHAPIAAALLVALAVDLLLGALVALALAGPGLDLTGSLALAAGVAGVGLVFAGIGALASQVTSSTRTASGLAGAVLAAAYVLRAIGDVGNGVASWASPIGWGQAVRPFAGERWWVVALFAVAALGLAVAAVWVNDHRDVGAGVIQPGPGPARASAALLRPVGLALRLQRGAVVGWVVALLLGGLAYGSIGGDVEDFVGDNEVIADLVAQGGGDVVDSFLGTTTLTLALIAAGFAVQAVLRLRTEEQAGRASLVVAAAVSRSRWAASHLWVVGGGTVAVLAAAGLGTGVAFALVEGDAAEVPRLTLAALAYAPAVLVVAGLTTAAYGLVARAAAVGWAALAGFFVLDFFGELLALPGWLRDLSPFRHIPTLPADDFALAPVLAVSAVAVALTALGLAALGRRDLVA